MERRTVSKRVRQVLRPLCHGSSRILYGTFYFHILVLEHDTPSSCKTATLTEVGAAERGAAEGVLLCVAVPFITCGRRYVISLSLSVFSPYQDLITLTREMSRHLSNRNWVFLQYIRVAIYFFFYGAAIIYWLIFIFFYAPLSCSHWSKKKTAIWH